MGQEDLPLLTLTQPVLEDSQGGGRAVVVLMACVCFFFLSIFFFFSIKGMKTPNGQENNYIYIFFFMLTPQQSTYLLIFSFCRTTSCSYGHLRPLRYNPAKL